MVPYKQIYTLGFQSATLYAKRTTKSVSRSVMIQSGAQVRTMTAKKQQNKEVGQQRLGTDPPYRNSD